MTRAAVLGAGAWGTTFAMVLADAGCDVTVWGRDAQVCRQIRDEHRNEAYLPGVALPAAVTAEADVVEAVRGADLVAVAVPSQGARALLEPLRSAIGPDTVVVSLMKGVEPVLRPADEPGCRRGARRAGGAGRGHLRTEPGARDRPAAADGHGRRQHGPGHRRVRRALRTVVVLPALHQPRRGGRRACAAP